MKIVNKLEKPSRSCKLNITQPIRMDTEITAGSNLREQIGGHKTFIFISNSMPYRSSHGFILSIQHQSCQAKAIHKSAAEWHNFPIACPITREITTKTRSSVLDLDKRAREEDPLGSVFFSATSYMERRY